MEEKNDTYVFSFEGKSEDVFEALEDPYSLTVTGVEIKDVELDFKMVVDKETFYIDKLESEVFAEKDGSTLTIKIEQSYDKMNSIDDIEIPQEVLDEAG